ncbi:MAG: hypothetical protein HY526_11905 [Betaproteobacteria bacterium]|nr:hypothetical protein [Betaproteobacteria bacterium]
MEKRTPGALVDPAWVADHGNDPNICLIEVAGLGQDDLQAYKAGHVPGAYPWKWKETLWESHMRDFPSPAEFARVESMRIRRDGVLNALGRARTVLLDAPRHGPLSRPHRASGLDQCESV